MNIVIATYTGIGETFVMDLVWNRANDTYTIKFDYPFDASMNTIETCENELAARTEFGNHIIDDVEQAQE